MQKIDWKIESSPTSYFLQNMDFHPENTMSHLIQNEQEILNTKLFVVFSLQVGMQISFGKCGQKLRGVRKALKIIYLRNLYETDQSPSNLTMVYSYQHCQQYHGSIKIPNFEGWRSKLLSWSCCFKYVCRCEFVPSP